jgi:pimeloyl-ACP methyl ester carboxylesterase
MILPTRCDRLLRSVVHLATTPGGDDEHASDVQEPTVIDIGTTKLYHEVRGSGPAMLLISGSVGDADDWLGVAPALAEEFTVVTYDRRGFSRSPGPPGWSSSSVSEQADDAAALLRTLGLAPAVVVGSSAGGSIVCDLVTHHPELVRHAVIHEPPLLAVVPDGQEIIACYRAAALEAMAEGGPRLAMEGFMRANAGDEVFDSIDREVRERMLDNGAVLFSIELPWVMTFVPDPDRMRASGVPLTVVVGADNRDTWFGDGASWLADQAGATLVEQPGGHVGFDSHPKEFVELIHRLVG